MLETLRDIIQWDIRNWSPALSFWKSHLDDRPKLKCLELGSNKGGLSLWLASLGHQIICSDLENPFAKANPIHRHYGVERLISYEPIDASNIPYENNFDIVVFKSMLGGIGRNNNISIQRKVIEEIHKSLKPGGKLLFAENLRGSAFHQFFRKKFTPWGDSWRYITVKEMEDFLQLFSSIELKTGGFLGTFGRSEVQRNILGSFDNVILNRIVPKNWKYIVFGVACK